MPLEQPWDAWTFRRGFEAAGQRIAPADMVVLFTVGERARGDRHAVARLRERHRGFGADAAPRCRA